MAITPIGQVRFGALAGAPELPKGYHFEIAAELRYVPEYDDPCGTRFAARVVEDWHPKKRAFNNPRPWIEFDDITTLLQAMLARHRIGVSTHAPV